VLTDLVLGALAFDGQHPPVHPQQRHAPLGQLIQGRHRPRDHSVHFPHLFVHGRVLGATADHRDINTEFVDHLAQKLAATQEWFDECQPKVRPGQRQRYPGQPRSTTDVGHSLIWLEELGHRGAIKEVPVPQSVDFAGTYQSPFDASPREDLGVPLSEIRTRSEEGVHPLRRRRHLDMFHVKHPPDLAQATPRTTPL
jgi:hypothetical protein